MQKYCIIFLCNKNNMSNNYQEESDEEQTITTQKKYINLPKFVKNSMENISENQIVINVSKTQYEVIQIAAQELGWVVSTSKKSENWDVMWVDRYIETQQLFRLNDNQKISHFPGIDIFAKKNLLGKNLMKLSKYFPEEYNYFPWTWSLPSQYGELKRHQQKLSAGNKKQIFIFKPSASCQGKGIKLTQDIEELDGKAGIAQIYINNPLLIENLKFDLRLYVLVYGHDPMRIYLYQQGLARFATEKYSPAEKANMKDTFVHLTNYAINKNNKKFVFNNDQANMDKGHKRSVSSVYNYLAKKGVNISKLKQKIEKMIVKTLLIGQPMLSHIYHLSQPDNGSNDLAFHILGFDVLITQTYEPLLLQINHTPSFTIDTPLDNKIKKNLIKDTFKILNISVQSKKQQISKQMEFLQKRSQRKTVKLTNSEKNILKQKIHNQKNEYQKNNPCGYKRIYPVQNQVYKKIETQAIKIFQQENRMKASKISPSKSKSNLRQKYTISPSKYKRSSCGEKEQIKIGFKKNQSFHETNHLKKIPYSETMPLRPSQNSILPNISAICGRQFNVISLSAHFPKTTVRKIEFKGDNMFRDVEKKKVLQTQKIEKKKKKPQYAEGTNQGQNQQPLIVPSIIDLLFMETLTLRTDRKPIEKDKPFFEVSEQTSFQLFKMRRNERQKLRNILFIKKKASNLASMKSKVKS